jgi:hypothetical protein
MAQSDERSTQSHPIFQLFGSSKWLAVRQSAHDAVPTVHKPRFLDHTPRQAKQSFPPGSNFVVDEQNCLKATDSHGQLHEYKRDEWLEVRTNSGDDVHIVNS